MPKHGKLRLLRYGLGSGVDTAGGVDDVVNEGFEPHHPSKMMAEACKSRPVNAT